MKSSTRFIALIALTLITFAAGAATATQGVSPGETDRLAQVNNSCPTFSWQGVPEAAQYEIVAYSLHSDGNPAEVELTAEAEALYSRVPAGATSWTPSTEQCFAPGERYVWFVRSVTELIDDQIIQAGEWSAGRYFSVPAGPSAEEVARAVEVLKQWETANGGGSLLLSSGTGTGTGASHRKGEGEEEGEGEDHRKSVPTASAAIKGENPETDIEAYGVVGSSASVYGAGVAAVNTEGGADLVLDGSIDGMPDTRISEWGIDRSDPTDQVFAMTNSGGGGFTLDVFGVLRGTDLECPGCVSPSDLEEESVTSLAIEDDGITDMDIAPGAVHSVHIFDGSVQANDLAPDAIGGGAIVDGSITAADLADGAVSRSKIATSAIGTLQIDDEAVTADKISAGAVGPSQIAFESIGESQLADEAVTQPKIAPGAVDASVLADAAVTGAKLADGAVSTSKLRNNAVIAEKIAEDAVTSAKILNGSVTMSDLAADSVGSDQIEHGGVRTSDINLGAVGTEQLANGAVTAAKLASDAIGAGSLADGSVTSATIADGTIAAVDLADGAVTASKLADGSVQSAKLGPGAVSTDKLHDAAVTNSKLAMNSVTASRILDGSIVGADLADGAVSAIKLGLNSVTGAHIVDGAVGSADLATDSVTVTKIAEEAVTTLHVENGTLTAEDVDQTGGIYASKNSLYVVEQSSLLNSGSAGDVTAYCADENDLPLTTACDTHVIYDQLYLERIRIYGWANQDSAAGVGCAWINNDGGSIEITAVIVCVAVPGP